ncbi:MAG: EthD family reductase [Actinomycetota bacterium]|nr:EthD family reductase [Actinomycetota bacterium]
MHRLLVSYGRPDDPEAFDAYYRDVHTPLALQQPGLIGLTIGHGTSLDPSQPAPYLVAELDFESEQAMGEALKSPEGRATGKDLANFATGGVTLAHFDVQTVR